MTDFSTTWKDLLKNIRPKVSAVNFNNWIKQIRFLDAGETVVRLGAPNNFVRDWVEKYYKELIAKELFELTKKELSLEFEVIGDDNISYEEPAGNDAETSIQTPPVPQPQKRTSTNLNKKYTFEKFVVGSSNELAHGAAVAVANLPGGCYNPLFIYGGVGLGKTHLLNAIGIRISERMPNLRIIALSGEQFMNEYIFSIRFEKMDQFRKKYREGCDVLLVDDVQFLAGKDATQDEFFHTFNVLFESQRQIVVTSDKFPKDLHGMEERLRSRFEWGLIADIKPPDLETRVAILKKKADLNNIKITDDVALFLATQVRSNVRELEGSLVRLSAFSSLHGVPITVDLAKEVMKNIISERAAGCSIEEVQRVVAESYHIKVSDLKSERRLKSISMPRQIAMYLCKKHLGVSYPEIGHKFGGKDHSTVIHAVKKISSQIEKDDILRKDIEIIEKALS